jgi:hypothetical protein
MKQRQRNKPAVPLRDPQIQRRRHSAGIMKSAVATADVDELQAKAAEDMEPEAYVTLDDTATLMYTPFLF